LEGFNKECTLALGNFTPQPNQMCEEGRGVGHKNDFGRIRYIYFSEVYEVLKVSDYESGLMKHFHLLLRNR